MLPWILNLGMTGGGGKVVAQTAAVAIVVAAQQGTVSTGTLVAQTAAVSVAVASQQGSVSAATAVAQTSAVSVAVDAKAGSVFSSTVIAQTGAVAVAVEAKQGTVSTEAASATTSGGNYGSRYYPAPPSKKKKKTKPKLKLVQTESVEKTQQISEILKGIAENDESPQEKIASLEKVLAEQKENTPGMSPEVLSALSALAQAHIQNIEALADLQSQINFAAEKMKEEVATGTEKVLARIEQMQADGDRAKLLQELSRLESQEATEQDRLRALLVALASV